MVAYFNLQIAEAISVHGFYFSIFIFLYQRSTIWFQSFSLTPYLCGLIQIMLSSSSNAVCTYWRIVWIDLWDYFHFILIFQFQQWNTPQYSTELYKLFWLFCTYWLASYTLERFFIQIYIDYVCVYLYGDSNIHFLHKEMCFGFKCKLL